ncbi:Circadian clock protein KaiC [Natrarchaeobaculum sulfurireducens]|uniref:non-specific serine/threonine protein kinase n=1 Tax=Natrarchaeobaculum sulfurireducens TaxID=2044521 RepID=A0A346PFH7_9EURY|nr:RecA-superfamily ATPase implicated in signal transduction [Natrarchaeobaculum sulfurireducens]AXR81696.1 Circadian clock protein KaiC [Natrarchaeobaculum sulfurireducens]
MAGLDEILFGGVVMGRLYLVVGRPGTGKTLLGIEFLRTGLENDETVLFVHGEESETEIHANASSFGIDLSAAEFLDLGPDSDFFEGNQSYDLVDTRDIESDQFIEDIRDAIEEINPDRVLLDPISQLQYIEPSEYQFRKRLISFMRFLKGRGTTVIATQTPSKSRSDNEIRSLSDGIIELERGEGGRRVSVPKHRGIGQQDGTHGLEIREDGLAVYPSLIPDQFEREFIPTQITSGIDELDTMLGGGLERGTATFISGPTGVGKTTTGTQFLAAAAEQGGSPVAYLFEESPKTFVYRSESTGTPLSDLEADGALSIEAVEPLSLSAEEFAQRVKMQVDVHGSEVVMIDGVDGYKVAIQGDEEALGRKLHGLIRYLKSRDVTVLLLDETEQVTGMPSASSANISYIADNILLLNYIEQGGELRKGIGVLKKRASDFERTMREFQITSDGIVVGEPLTDVEGILEGTPRWTGDGR